MWTAQALPNPRHESGQYGTLDLACACGPAEVLRHFVQVGNSRAPSGCPFDKSPPETFTGMRPPSAVSPLSIKCPPSAHQAAPGRISCARFSSLAKQSCVDELQGSMRPRACHLHYACLGRLARHRIDILHDLIARGPRVTRPSGRPYAARHAPSIRAHGHAAPTSRTARLRRPRSPKHISFVFGIGNHFSAHTSSSGVSFWYMDFGLKSSDGDS